MTLSTSYGINKSLLVKKIVKFTYALYAVPCNALYVIARHCQRRCRGNLPEGNHIKSHARYFCTCVEKKAHTSKRVSIFASDNVISKAQCAPRGTVRRSFCRFMRFLVLDLLRFFGTSFSTKRTISRRPSPKLRRLSAGRRQYRKRESARSEDTSKECPQCPF